MKPGDVVLISLPQIAGGIHKLRPALILTLLPGAFQNLLICGIVGQIADDRLKRLRERLAAHLTS